MKRVSAVVIGGSNTVMKPGYLTELPRCMQAHGVDLNVSANLAVGNTSIFMGLIALKSNVEALKAADALLIEYTLNDTGFYASSLERVERWARGMEGAIRYARAVNPKIKIIPIIFATRTGLHRKGINLLHSGVHYFANYYGLQVVDVNAELVLRFGSDVADAPGVYQDFAHYQRPVFTTIAAEIIAAKASQYLASELNPATLPDPVCEGEYSGANLISHGAVSGLRTERFKNYLYDESTFDLASGSLAIEIEDGALLAIKYVCTDDAAQLHIETNGEWFRTMTMQPGMVEPKYKFLLSMLLLDELPAGQETNRYVLTACAPQGTEVKTLRQVGAKPPVRPEARLAVATVLYTGRLKKLEVAQATETALAQVV